MEPVIILKESKMVESPWTVHIQRTYSNAGENVETKMIWKDIMTAEMNAYHRVCNVMEHAQTQQLGWLDHSGNVEMNAGLTINIRVWNGVRDGGVVLMELAGIRVSAVMIHFREPARQMRCYADTAAGCKYFVCTFSHVLCHPYKWTRGHLNSYVTPNYQLSYGVYEINWRLLQ